MGSCIEALAEGQNAYMCARAASLRPKAGRHFTNGQFDLIALGQLLLEHDTCGLARRLSDVRLHTGCPGPARQPTSYGAYMRRCAARGLRHLRTRPYTPQTNGKAERFIQLLLHSWAYAFAYPSSAHRTRAVPSWLRGYNRRRPHGSLGGHPPVSRVAHLCGQYT